MPKLHYSLASWHCQNQPARFPAVDLSVTIETAAFICIKQPGQEWLSAPFFAHLRKVFLVCVYMLLPGVFA